MGWQVIAKKDEFKPGDMCVFCEIDSVLPERPEFEFLRPKKFRIRTMKLGSTISQGIIFPLDIFENYGNLIRDKDGTIIGVEIR